MKLGARGALFVVIFLSVSCTSKSPKTAVKETTSPSLRMKPIHVRATKDKTQLAVDAYDAAGLFDRASASLRNGQFDDAVRLYRQLAAEFTDSDFAAPSLYNSGLCNEHQRKFQAAVSDYKKLIHEYPHARDIGDAMFRLAGAYEQLEAWADAVATLNTLLNDYPNLPGIERIEALARKGSNLIQLGETNQARLALEEASLRFRSGRDLPPFASTYFYAMAHFKIGEIVQTEMSEATLPADETLLEAALERKCQLLLDAQNEYTKTIRIAHPHWAAAAAYRIGNLYHSLWEDLVSAPVPRELTEEERAIYTELLKDRIQVLLTKATRQWKRTLKMARRLNLNSEWIEQTTLELEEVGQKMLTSESVTGKK
jgi:tetratricopeptide (TPR) repeat protein